MDRVQRRLLHQEPRRRARRGCNAEKSQSSKIDERQVAGRHDGLEYDKDVRSGVGSFCVDVEISSARRCGAAKAQKSRSRKISPALPSLFGTASRGGTRTRLTVEVQDLVAEVGQSPASASASRTAAQGAAGLQGSGESKQQKGRASGRRTTRRARRRQRREKRS